jgi:ankyrin repeat protein
MLIPVQTFVETEGDEILATRDDKGHTPAHWACLGGHITILRYMMEHKAPIDEPSDNDLAQVLTVGITD